MPTRTVPGRGQGIQGPDHIDDHEYLVVDVETTGLSPDQGDRVCEVGAVKLRGNAVVETFESLINPERPISAGAFAVNGISPAMVATAPAFPGVAAKLWEMMEGTVLVAYNAPFDRSFLVSEFRMAGFPPVQHHTVDALALARQLLPGLGRYPQENVARVMGISSPVRHRALGDAMITARIFLTFSLMMKAYDLTTIADFGRKDLTPVLTTRRLGVIREAISGGQALWIRYLSPTGNEITERVVSPKESAGGSSGPASPAYLIGYCHASRGERNFRVDRILDLRIVPSPQD